MNRVGSRGLANLCRVAGAVLALSSLSLLPLELANAATRISHSPSAVSLAVTPHSATQSPGVLSVPPTAIASLTKSIPGYSSPGGKQVRVVSDRWLGAPVITPIIGISDGYYKIRLPMRPNESTTWVKATDVLVTSTPYRIIINLKTTHLQLLKLGTVVYKFPIGVGVAADPTPTGNFFVTFYATSDGPGYGPWMMMTSAHSNAILNWSGTGDALISLHGPLGADRLIGKTGARVSHGCIRLHIADQKKLIVVPDGTPIQIVN